MEVMCKARNEGNTDCPYLPYCLARMTDPTIKGCGIPLYMAGIISKGDIMVLHSVKKAEDKPKRKRKTKVKPLLKGEPNDSNT